MKIAYISGVKFGYDLLKEILEKNFEISIVFSYDDSKNSVYSDYTTFEPLCKKFGIQNIKVNNINDLENIELLKKIKPDLILVMGWSQLLKEPIIQTAKLGVIGSHPTELPKFRGRAPIPWTILKNLKHSALTFFLIEKGIDDGDILNQKKFKISSNDDSQSLYKKITYLGKTMIIETIQNFQNGNVDKIPQDESKFIEYWPKRTPADGEINWFNTAKEISTLIRATTFPYPGAYTFFNGSILKIFKASFTDANVSKPGIILDVKKNIVTVGTNYGSISFENVKFNSNDLVSVSKIFSKDDIGKKLG